MTNKVRLCLLAIFLCCCQSASAVTSKIEVKVDRTTIQENESITFSVFIHNLDPDFVKFPQDTADYSVTATSSSKSFRLVNGQSDKSITYKYVIKPKHTGTFTIPTVKVKAGALSFDTDPLEITVNQIAATPPPAKPPQLPKLPKNSARSKPKVAAKKPEKDVFAKFELSNTKPYPNEQIKLAVKIYHRGNLRSLNFKPLQLDNFIVQRDNKAKEYQEIVDLNEFYVYEIDFILLPVKAGPVLIPATDIDAVVIEDRAVNDLDPFRFMNPFLVEKSRTLTAPEIKVDVQPIPKGAPKDFTGYVGELAVVHKLKSNEVKSGEALSLETKINGDGNFQTLNTEMVQESKQYSIFSDKENLSEEIVDGRNYFEASRSTAIITSKTNGKLSIKTTPLVSFNPKTGKFETHGYNKFAVEVLENPDMENTSPLVNERLAPKPDQTKNETILTLSTEAILDYKEPPLKNKDLVLVFILINLFAFLIKIFKRFKGFESPSRSENKSIRSYIKKTREAQRVSEISILLRELSSKVKTQDEIETKLTKFFEESDKINYSMQGDNGSSQQLEYFRLKAIELIKELANAK